MSLDTTINLTVRQKGKIGDQFIGYISIPLRNFSITPKLITHWYKLGSRPGKVKSKLRGDLQVSIKFLSNWSSTRGSGNPYLEEIGREGLGEFGVRSSSLSNGINQSSPISRRMLARSKSDMKIKVRDMIGTNFVDGKPASPKVKDRLATAIRRSFRKKNRAPVFQECDDDFTFTHTPPEMRKRSSTIGGHFLKGAHSDTDSWTNLDMSQPQSPATVHPSIQVQSSSTRESESSGDNQEEGGVSEVNGLSLRERKRDWARGSKRRWTMNTLPPIPLGTPTSSGSARTPSFSPSPSPSYVPSDGGKLLTEGGATPNDNEEDSDEAESSISTYRAKTSISPHPLRRGFDRQRSYSVTSSQSSVRSALVVEQEATSESKAEATTPTHSASSSRRVLKDQAVVTSHSNSTQSGIGVAEQTSPAAEGGVSEVDSNSGDGGISERGKNVPQTTSSSSKSSTVSSAGGVESSKVTSSTAPKKSRPIVRRNTSAAVMSGRSRGGHVTSRTKAEGSGRGSGTGDPSRLTPRKKALSPPATPNKKLLPATPVRRSEKANLAAASRPRSMILNGTGSSPANVKASDQTKKDSKVESSTATSTNGDHETKRLGEVTSQSDSKNEEHFQSEESKSEKEKEKKLSVPQSDSTTSGNSASTVDRKTRHTVAYKDTSPLYKGGFQPVSLLPPSMADYQSQTLPSRGKLARRQTTDALMSKLDSQTDRDHTLPRAGSTHRINRSPQNTMLVHRDSMNYVTSDRSHVTSDRSHVTSDRSHVTSRPSTVIPTTAVDDQEEVDGVGELATLEICSKSSVTSFSSTSTNSRPSTPSTPKYGAKTPGEIVASALRNRTRPPSGVLRKAIGMYQENRRQSQRIRKSSQEARPRSCFIEELEETEEKEKLEVEGRQERVSASAGNSPQLRRNRSAAETLTGLLKNPFSSLRRSKSNAAGSETPSPTSRPVGMLEGGGASNSGLDSTLEEGGDLGISADILERLRRSRFSQSRTSLELGENSSSQNLEQKTSAPALMAYRCKNEVKGQSKPTHSKAANSKSKERPDPVIKVRPPSMVESGSVKTLTELDATLRESTGSPNPAGASPPFVGGLGHSRHTTCSSVDSEGFVSVTSEELSLEELSHQDLSHWSKEDLVKELVSSKQALKRKDQELKDIKSYLDNLLLRIMDSDPTILSSSK